MNFKTLAFLYTKSNGKYFQKVLEAYKRTRACNSDLKRPNL